MLQVNLLPWRRIRLQRQSRFWLTLAFSIPALMVTGGVCLSVFEAQERALVHLHLSALEASAQRLSSQQRLTKAASDKVALLTEQRLHNQERTQRSADYVKMLSLLATKIPADLWLRQLNERRNQLTLKGEGRFYHDILAFRDMLSASEILSDVSLSDVQLLPNHVLSFAINARIRPLNLRPVSEATP